MKKPARHSNALAIVKNAVKKRVPIKPSSTVHIFGYTDKEMPYSTTTAMLHTSVLQQSWRDLEIEHGLIQYQNNNNVVINVQLSWQHYHKDYHHTT